MGFGGGTSQVIWCPSTYGGTYACTCNVSWEEGWEIHVQGLGEGGKGVVDGEMGGVEEIKGEVERERDEGWRRSEK
jgi:hypothetical protein